MEKQELEKQETDRLEQAEENPMVKKRWFGRGIYGSKDVPIRLLDGFIGVLVAVIIAMIIFFAIRGGFWITFDSAGGSQVAKQKVRHGETIEMPETPVKPGYVFEGWEDTEKGLDWDFETNTVTGSMTLSAKWAPAEITVKFDLDGGTVEGQSEAEPRQVTFGEAYGKLPTPEKEGFSFAGWFYSGSRITEDTQVITSGEHILTAAWE